MDGVAHTYSICNGAISTRRTCHLSLTLDPYATLAAQTRAAPAGFESIEGDSQKPLATYLVQEAGPVISPRKGIGKKSSLRSPRLPLIHSMMLYGYTLQAGGTRAGSCCG